MSHDKIFGVCENKCFVEAVPSARLKVVFGEITNIQRDGLEEDSDWEIVVEFDLSDTANKYSMIGLDIAIDDDPIYSATIDGEFFTTTKYCLYRGNKAKAAFTCSSRVYHTESDVRSHFTGFRGVFFDTKQGFIDEEIDEEYDNDR